MNLKNLKTIKKKSVFWTLLSTGLIPALVSVLVLCTVFLFVIVRSSRAVEEAKGENLASQATAVMDRAFSDALSAVQKVSESEWLHDQFISYCLSGNPLTSIQKNDAVISLSRIVAEQSTYISRISMVYFDMPTTEYSSTGVFENLPFYQKMVPDKFEYAYFADAPKGISQVTVGGKRYLLYSEDVSVVKYGKKRANINVFLNEEAILKTIGDASSGLLESCELSDESGSLHIRLGKETETSQKYVEISRSASTLPVICTIRIPEEEYYKTTRKSVPLLIIIILIDFALCIGLSLHYSRKTYKPLKETLERFGGSSSKENEFQALNSIMDKAFEDKEEALKSLNAIFPVARQRVLRSYIDGSAFAGGREDLLARCGIEFPYPIFNAATICTSLTDVFETDIDRDLEIQMAALAMEDYVKKASDGLFLVAYLYVHDASRFSIVLNYRSEEDLKVFVHRLQEYCTHAGTNVEQAVCSIGIGNPTDQKQNIHISCDQADFALNYSSAGSNHGIRYYQDVAKEAKVLFFFSHSEQMLLSKAISKGDYQEAKRIILEILETNESVSTPYSLGLLFASICSTMITMAQECGVDVQISREPETPRTIEEIRDRTLKLADEICNNVQSRENESITEEDRKVLDYIDSHLYDPGLSLSSVADAFHRSQAAISEAFKKMTGKKYIDYVNEKRIQKAMELIYRDNLDMNKVYTEVGYVSMSTFRRNYRRYAGIDKETQK